MQESAWDLEEAVSPALLRWVHEGVGHRLQTQMSLFSVLFPIVFVCVHVEMCMHRWVPGIGCQIPLICKLPSMGGWFHVRTVCILNH